MTEVTVQIYKIYRFIFKYEHKSMMIKFYVIMLYINVGVSMYRLYVYL